MSIEKIFENRVLKLNKKEENTKGKYVLYCMEASQRQEFNHALEFSIYKANYYKKPVLVVFFITDKYKFSNQRYYRFIIEGLIKLKKDLKDRGINFLIIKDYYVNGCIKLSKEACLVVLDKNYLKTQRLWRRKVADFVDVCVYEVESEVIFPIQFLFNKSIPYAFLYRDKVEKFFDYFLLEVKQFEPIIKSNDLNIYLDNVIDFNEVQEYLNILNIDKSISTVEKYYQGGSDIANKLLKEFIEKKLPFYKDNRSDPTLNYTSNLSPYLHFGQISPLKIVIEILKYYDKRDENVQSFFNELIVFLMSL
jgi:deoxyribodipyrimidine photo-lyase